MSYEVKLNEDDAGIVEFTYNGTVTLEERKKAVDDACTLFTPKRPRLLLVDVRELEMDLTINEQRMFGEYVAANPELIDACVAVLHKNNNNPNLLIDTIAFNNGYRLAQFNDEKEALDWLKGV